MCEHKVEFNIYAFHFFPLHNILTTRNIFKHKYEMLFTYEILQNI